MLPNLKNYIKMLPFPLSHVFFKSVENSKDPPQDGDDQHKPILLLLNKCILAI